MHRPKTYRRKSRKAGGKRSTKRRGGMGMNFNGTLFGGRRHKHSGGGTGLGTWYSFWD